MSFWTVLSCCFSSPVKRSTRPRATVSLNGFQTMGLFDTGSTVTLVNAALKPRILAAGSNAARPPQVRLCGADGKELRTAGCYSIECSFGAVNLFHNVLFIHDLQVDCIIGMDLMARGNVVIDTVKRSIKTSRSPAKTDFVLLTQKAKVYEPQSETLLSLPSPVHFSQGLVEAAAELPDGLHVMDGVTRSQEGHVQLVIANFSHLPIKLPSKSAIAKLSVDPAMKVTPLAQCLSISTAKPAIFSTSHVDAIPLDNIPYTFQSQYRNLLRSYADVFSTNDLDIGHCRSLPHHVRLKDPNRLTAINQYRLPYHLKEVAIDYVQKLLAAGVVRKSTSVFNSPLMLVKKPHADPKKPLAEQYRLVHNYVDLNRNISPCSYPLRHLYELLDEVAAGTVYSVLDLSQGFFQQHLIDPQEATSFSIPGVGQFTYCRSPQGLNSSPAYFQRLLDHVLQGISRVYVYIDDVVVSVTSHQENLQKLSEVFSRFRQHNLKIKPSKCTIGAAKITYLGYDICKTTGISPGKAKTEVIKNWPEPRSVKDVRAFIGLTSFFRRAIANFSTISGDLNKLIRKDSGYKSGPLPPAARSSFLALKDALISKPCLAPVNFSKRFYVTCDASATHYGSCLSQIGDDGIERPCGYASKLLSEKESRQTPGLRERAALLFAFRHWKPYLVGKEFTVRTDHKPNVSLADGKTTIYDSLSDEIMQYMPFKLVYMKGSDMFVDALSRPPAVSINSIWSDEQMRDPVFARLIKFKRAKKGSLSPSELTMHNRSSLNASGELTDEQGRLFAPLQKREEIMTRAHDAAGHFSAAYTLEKIQAKYTWPGITSDVANFTKSCIVCAQSNVARPRKIAPLEPIRPKATYMGDRIHIDLVDMPKSCEGHVAICTLVDAATGFVVAHPVLNKTSQAVSSTLTDKFFPYFGCPKVLVTDKGTENMNSEIAALLANYDIQHIASSTAHPQSNGMVERRQQMILAYFRKTTDTLAEQSLWHLKIPEFQTIINSTSSSSRGFSPFFMTYFRHANFPFRSMLSNTLSYNEESRVNQQLNLARKTIREAEANVERSFSATKAEFDKKSRSNNIQPGDLVMIKTSQRKLHHKLAKPYKGPYLCLAMLPHNNIRVVKVGGRKPEKVHLNNCKRLPTRKQLFRFSDKSHSVPVPTSRSRSIPQPLHDSDYSADSESSGSDLDMDPDPDDPDLEEQQNELPNPPDVPGPDSPARSSSPSGDEIGAENPAVLVPDIPPPEERLGARPKKKQPKRKRQTSLARSSSSGSDVEYRPPARHMGPPPEEGATTRYRSRQQQVILPSQLGSPLPFENTLSKLQKKAMDFLTPSKNKKQRKE